MTNLANWTPRPRPARTALEGRYCCLEPLDPQRHGDHLFAASMAPGAEERFRYLFDVPQDRPAFGAWLERSAASTDPLFYAVIDAATGRCEGRQTFMRIVPEHGVIEIGNILWGPAIARTRVATEALFLFARHAFDALGYRRFEWKCHALNAPSRRAALRFGFAFEGIFRNHMVTKGANRDTAWFAMIDADWPRIRDGFERWLAPENFDGEGRQRLRLADALGAGAPPDRSGGRAIASMADASGFYEVERRATHAARPGFRIQELQISPTQQVPWHYHTSTQDTFYVLAGSIRVFLREPKAEVRLGPGESYTVPPGRAHLVVNGGDASATFLVLQGIGEYDFVPLVPKRTK